MRPLRSQKDIMEDQITAFNSQPNPTDDPQWSGILRQHKQVMDELFTIMACTAYKQRWWGEIERRCDSIVHHLSWTHGHGQSTTEYAALVLNYWNTFKHSVGIVS